MKAKRIRVTFNQVMVQLIKNFAPKIQSLGLDRTGLGKRRVADLGLPCKCQPPISRSPALSDSKDAGFQLYMLRDVRFI